MSPIPLIVIQNDEEATYRIEIEERAGSRPVAVEVWSEGTRIDVRAEGCAAWEDVVQAWQDYILDDSRLRQIRILALQALCDFAVRASVIANGPPF